MRTIWNCCVRLHRLEWRVRRLQYQLWRCWERAKLFLLLLWAPGFSDKRVTPGAAWDVARIVWE
jgi:hypothetical protein